MPDLTPEQIEAIREREANATPGPWREVSHPAQISKPDGPFRDILSIEDDAVALSVYESDSALIAHARSDIPALLTEVERLRAEIDPFLEDHGRFHPDFWLAGRRGTGQEWCPACDLGAALSPSTEPTKPSLRIKQRAMESALNMACCTHGGGSSSVVAYYEQNLNRLADESGS